MAEPPPYPGVPRWVKMFGIVVIVVVLLIFVVRMFVGGEHGPGRHAQSGDAVLRAPSSSVVEDHAPQGLRG